MQDTFIIFSNYLGEIDVGQNPPTKPRRQGFSLCRCPTSVISLSTGPDRFYPSQQHPHNGQILTRDVQGRAIETKFLVVRSEDMASKASIA